MIKMNKERFGEYVRSFQFKELFNYFGWNNDRVAFPPIEIEDDIYAIASIAEKSGFRVVECMSLSGKPIPHKNIRNRIESIFSKISHDHIIIFTDNLRQGQVWQFVYRTMSQGVKRIEVPYDIRMNPEKIYERASGLVFTLDEEDKITIIDVIERVKGALSVNSEKVTKRFYDYFKSQQKSMVDAIKGIDLQEDKEWYASLMINRLMFCYFIQKRRFLNNDMNYLNNKLKECQTRKIDSFHSFYRNFLLVLFHDGFATFERDDDLIKTIGIVPYLNGGLFDIHYLERKYSNICISDETFEKLFAFFDTWDWHLDSNNISSSTEINPDVLGYIFEKYINDRAKLGAYYTKEDITEYMARTTILSSLLDKVKQSYPIAFTSGGTFLEYLKASNLNYVYDSVSYGLTSDYRMPDEAEWNSLANSTMNIGKETNLDVYARYCQMHSFAEQMKKLTDLSSDFMVQHNIDIRSLVYDYINETHDYGFVYHFYDELQKLSVLDPACGSGAFLLAAINVLEPLYEACLTKMTFITNECNTSTHYSFAIEDIELYNHSENSTYWICKKIISKNLYGVDIISEAVEITKLRLFLKMMACVEPDYSKPNMGIEPLPDLDYKLNTGNTLVGFVTMADVMSCSTTPLNQERLMSITLKCRDLKELMAEYEELLQNNADDFKKREMLKSKINNLRIEATDLLNRVYFSAYGSGEYGYWLHKTKPLHWLSTYPVAIKDNNGFDVIIGNPPYVKNDEVSKQYSLNRYITKSCGNLYACFVERSQILGNQNTVFSMILQLPIACTDGMEVARQYLFDNYNILYFATFDDRPGKLFEELQHIRVSIVTAKKQGKKNLYTTKFIRWYSETRGSLFKNLIYYKWNMPYHGGSIAKIGDSILESIVKKLNSCPIKFVDKISKKGTYKLYYHNAPLYWIRGSLFSPYFYNERDGEGTSSQYKEIRVSDEKTSNLLLAILNSSLFYLWFVVYGDMRHLNKRDIETFPWCDISDDTNIELAQILNDLMLDYENHKTRKECRYDKTGLVIYDEYHPKASKQIMDRLDDVLAKLYGFTETELQFIINYDIKFRLGGAKEDDN